MHPGHVRSQSQQRTMPRPIPIHPPPAIPAATAMETDSQSLLICPPDGPNSASPPIPHEITVAAAAKVQAGEESEVMNSVDLSGGHTELDIAPALEATKTPPKK